MGGGHRAPELGGRGTISNLTLLIAKIDFFLLFSGHITKLKGYLSFFGKKKKIRLRHSPSELGVRSTISNLTLLRAKIYFFLLFSGHITKLKGYLSFFGEKKKIR